MPFSVFEIRTILHTATITLMVLASSSAQGQMLIEGLWSGNTAHGEDNRSTKIVALSSAKIEVRDATSALA